MDKEKIIKKIEKLDFEIYNYALDPHWRGATTKQATDRICRRIRKKNILEAKLAGTPAEVNKPQSGEMT